MDATHDRERVVRVHSNASGTLLGVVAGGRSSMRARPAQLGKPMRLALAAAALLVATCGAGSGGGAAAAANDTACDGTHRGDLESWVDHGPILTSQPGDDYNAIDPQVFSAGRDWYLVYGSFWSGINMQPLSDMRTPGEPRRSLASNPVDPPNPIENAQVFRRGDDWYLAVSWEYCCRGLASTYKIAVGRSATPIGPFVDRDRVPMTEGGGTIVLDRRGHQIGPGALDVVEHEDRLYAVHHYYDADTGGTIRMQIREVEWRDGWPYFSGGDDQSPPATRRRPTL